MTAVERDVRAGGEQVWTDGEFAQLLRELTRSCCGICAAGS